MGDAFRMSHGFDWQVKSEWAGQHRSATTPSVVMTGSHGGSVDAKVDPKEWSVSEVAVFDPF
jgi:hypothetical protein